MTLLVKVVGASGSGKTSVSAAVGAHFHSAVSYVPPWPSFADFLQHPRQLAYRNQVEALVATRVAIAAAERTGRVGVVDSSLERCHLIHSRELHARQWLSDQEISSLDWIFESLRATETREQLTLFLEAPPVLLRARIRERTRLEDKALNMAMLERSLAFWDSWARESPDVVRLDAAAPLASVVRMAVSEVNARL